MYENVGRKLKNMASGIFMLILIVSVVVSIMKFVESGNAYEKADDSSSKYSEKAYEKEGVMLAVEGVVYLVAGPILGWMLTCAIYAFGELVEKTSNIERVVYMNDLKSGAGKQTPYKPASVPEVPEEPIEGVDNDFIAVLKDFTTKDLRFLLEDQSDYYSEAELTAIRRELVSRETTRDPFADGIPENLRRLREKGLITDSDLKKIYHYDASQDAID